MKEIIDMLMSNDTDTQLLGIRLYDHKKYKDTDLYNFFLEDESLSKIASKAIYKNLIKMMDILRKHKFTD